MYDVFFLSFALGLFVHQTVSPSFPHLDSPFFLFLFLFINGSDLQGNKLTGQIPDEIGDCTLLVYLYETSFFLVIILAIVI